MATPPAAQPPTTGARRSRGWLRRAGLALVGILVAVGAAELLVRTCWGGVEGGYPPGMFTAAEPMGFRLAPGFAARHTVPSYDIEIRTNSRGYRGDAVRPKQPGATRVLALGDSFCFGHGVEVDESYPAVLQELLRAGGAKVDVINTGVPGYGTANQYELLTTDAEQLDPDVVVLGLYAGNDFRDNHRAKFGRLVARSGILVTLSADQPDWQQSLKAFAAVHWRSAQLLLLGLAGAEQTEQQQIDAYCAALRWDAGFGAAMVEQPWGPDAEAAWSVTAGCLDQVAQLCAATARKLLVVVLPGPYQYHPALWSIVVQKCQLDPTSYDMAKPSQALLAWGQRAGVEVLDLLPVFRAEMAATKSPLYLDVHFNAAGHQLAAEHIAKRLPTTTIPGR